VYYSLTTFFLLFDTARYTVRTFSIRRNEKIACHVTVRGDKAEKILNLGLRVKDYEIKKSNFDENGCFGFGIEEHIDLGVKYDPSIGIHGMHFYVLLSRPGRRVQTRRHKKSKQGKKHRVNKADAMKWVQSTFQTAVV
jgi:large subunit ribosomal protein L11e